MNKISTIGIVYLIFFSSSFSASCIWLYSMVMEGKDTFYPICSIIISLTMIIMVIVSVIENDKEHKDNGGTKNDEATIH